MKRLGSGLAALLLALIGCSDVTTPLVSDRQTLAAEAGTPPRDAAANKDAALADASAVRVPAICNGHVCACDDGQDNDGDGRSDGFDPECTNPSDDDESSFGTGAQAGKNKCRDCFWDDNAGFDDDCRYPEECLSDPSFTGKGACSSCRVSTACVDNCRKRTPNGCDCFGCCEIAREDGTSVQVELSESCSLAKLDDTNACPRCRQSPDCQNPCGHCELCPGRTPDTLPADCTGGANGTPRYVCDERQPVCSETTACGAEQYCQLGCCLYEVY